MASLKSIKIFRSKIQRCFARKCILTVLSSETIFSLLSDSLGNVVLDYSKVHFWILFLHFWIKLNKHFQAFHSKVQKCTYSKIFILLHHPKIMNTFERLTRKCKNTLIWKCIDKKMNEKRRVRENKLKFCMDIFVQKKLI